MMWWNNGWGWAGGLGWGSWILMTVAMVAFWAVVVYGVVALFRPGRGGDAPVGRVEPPERILDERFARGEIGVEDYQTRKDVLQHSR